MTEDQIRYMWGLNDLWARIFFKKTFQGDQKSSKRTSRTYIYPKMNVTY